LGFGAAAVLEHWDSKGQTFRMLPVILRANRLALQDGGNELPTGRLISSQSGAVEQPSIPDPFHLDPV